MNIIVTGGCGFIGSTLIKYLLNTTEHHVANVDKIAYAGSTRNLETVHAHLRLSFFQTDICNTEALTHIFSSFKPDIVFNLAAESHVDRSIDAPEQSVETNILGTLHLLEVTRHYLASQSKAARKRFRFIQVSTDEVFGDLDLHEPSRSEDAAYHPSSPYSASKAGANHLVTAWHRTYGIPVMITHASDNYGPFQSPEKLIPLMILKAMRGELLPVYGDGQQTRNWLNVNDHVRGLMVVMEKGKTGEAYNIGGNCELTNIDLVKKICSILQQKHSHRLLTKALLEKNIVFVKDRPGHDYRYALNSSKIEKELGWKAQTPFDNGLEATIEWYLNNQSWCEKVLVNLSRHGHALEQLQE